MLLKRFKVGLADAVSTLVMWSLRADLACRWVGQSVGFSDATNFRRDARAGSVDQVDHPVSMWGEARKQLARGTSCREMGYKSRMLLY